MAMFLASCGNGSHIVSVGQEKSVSKEDQLVNSADAPSGDGTDNSPISDEDAVPPIMVTASYLTDCFVDSGKITCAINGNNFSSDFLNKIKIFDRNGSMVPPEELSSSIDGDVLVIIFPAQYDVTQMQIEDAEVPLAGSSINAAYLSINAGAAYTNTSNVNLSIRAVGAVSMFVTNAPGCINNGTWENYSESKAWTLESSDGEQSVYIKFRDANGQESTCLNETINLDSLPPSQIDSINDGDFSTTANNSPNISWSAAQDSNSGIIPNGRRF